ncbi:MAG: hypothetical protein VX278_13780 [Myxococcota bacterium]|nr:hypothetical protein [Myxococcota bacterium]
MIILLPTLLVSLSTQKFTALPLSVATSQSDLPQDPGRLIQKIQLIAQDDGFDLRAAVRATDVRASTEDVEQRKWNPKSLSELQAILQSLKKLDPQHRRIELQPLPSHSTADVVRWMDAVSKGKEGELFPEIIVQSQK